MTKELYNELVKKGLITDTKMSFEYINKYNLTLEDIITIPAILEMLTKGPVVEETVETVVEETVVEETVETVVEETVVEETVETVVEETVVEETVVEESKEEIVVDEPEVSTTSKSKGKKN